MGEDAAEDNEDCDNDLLLPAKTGERSGSAGSSSADRRLRCAFCNCSTYSELRLKLHVSSAHDAGVYKCCYCIFQTEFEDCLTRHVNARHGSENCALRANVLTMSCHQCRYQTSRADCLERHKEGQHGQAGLRLPQAIQDIEFKNAARNKSPKYLYIAQLPYDHKLSQHSRDSNDNFIAGKGNESLTDSTSDWQEMGRLNCGFCEYFCGEAAHLRAHMWLTHRVSHSFCGKCLYWSGSLQELRAHMASSGHDVDSSTTRQHAADATTPQSPLHTAPHLSPRHGGTDSTPYDDAEPLVVTVHPTQQQEKLLGCEYCGHQSGDEAGLRSHLWLAHRLSHFLCRRCCHRSESLRQMRRHTEEEHGEEPADRGGPDNGELTCRLCRHRAADTDSLRSHLAEAHLLPVYRCRYCRYSSRHRRAARGHVIREHTRRPSGELLIHKDEQLFRSFVQLPRLSCSRCEFETFSPEDMSEHSSSVHEGPAFQCIQCPLLFFKLAQLRKHYMSCHVDNNNSLTHYCPPVSTGGDGLGPAKVDLAESGRNCQRCGFVAPCLVQVLKHVQHKHCKSLEKTRVKVKRLNLRISKENMFHFWATVKKFSGDSKQTYS